MNKKKEHGFTLIELAIVLIIIGIILGAVLKGQELINNAKARRLQNDMNGLAALIWTYKDRKNWFPGDCDRDGVIEFDAPNNIAGTTPSNNTDPTIDYCATTGTTETDVNRVFSDIRVARVTNYVQPNRFLAKHRNDGYFNVGYTTVAGINYNAIFIYNVPAWMAKMIDVSIDGQEGGTIGRIRRHDTADGGAAWPTVVNNNTPVAVEYYFDKSP